MLAQDYWILWNIATQQAYVYKKKSAFHMKLGHQYSRTGGWFPEFQDIHMLAVMHSGECFGNSLFSQQKVEHQLGHRSPLKWLPDCSKAMEK